LKVPRKTHAQKDAAAAEQFQRTLCEQLASLNVAGGRSVRLWVADEHRYGLIPVVRKCWTLRGVRPTVPYRTKYEWAYLYSALEVDGQNAAEFLCLPEVSLEMSGLFLKHLAASDPNAEHIVIWDQAGFHPKPNLHAVPERVHLVALPPCQRLLNRLYRQEQFQFVGRQGNKTELLIIAFGVLIFCIHEKTNPARRVENLHEFPHRRHQQRFSDALPLICFGDGQPAKPDAGHITRQFLCFLLV
jgi:hypothetical protein